ncbi:restriction endonuclease subunit S [Halanaerobium sp.]|uniref:restriction endonuclease subunit S n=1 Tax=Halanaerobium sp. TaxID=1895664 RepID=UPI000DE6A9C2|nr:restriction endonuclease subunit S [Halanaerobium sp.]PUU87664.1 MAG: type I restriction enzyme, S subunit [Halanaerobium sp.]
MVKEGYKEANIGPLDYKIPVNWDIDYISDIESLELLSSGINNFKGEKKYLSTSSIERNKIIEIEELIEYKQRPSRANMQPVIDSVWFAKMKDTVKVYSYIEKNKNEIKEYIMSTGFIGIKCKENISVEFLNQYFLWNQFNKIKNVYSHGSTQQAVNMKDVRNLKLIIPPLPEQQKIASILSSVDKSIEKTDEVIEETKELKKGLMQVLLTKGIGHSEFKEVRVGTKIIKIPKEWDLLQFDKVYKKRNKRNKDDENYNYIGLEHIESGNINLAGYDNNGQERSSSRMFETGDILYGKLRPYLDKAAISKFDGICSTDIIPMYSTKLSTNKYLLYILHSKFFIDFAVSTMEGTNLPRTSWRVIKNLNIPVPPIKEQKKIASILSSVDDKIKKEEEYKAKLERLKKGLMQKLLTGEIRVNTEMEV